MWVTDVENNVGLMVYSAIQNPKISLPAKYVSVHSDILPYGDIFKVWSEVTGRRCEYLPVEGKQWERIFGVFGKEMADQFRLNEVAPDWSKPYGKDVVTAKDLGVELMSLRQALEANKDML